MVWMTPGRGRRVSVNYILFECEDFGPLSAKAAQFAILDCVAPLISHQWRFEIRGGSDATHTIRPAREIDRRLRLIPRYTK
jgi:hypothetical protein